MAIEFDQNTEALRQMIFAHRGLHGVYDDFKTEAPENSAIAFRRAAHFGMAIEIDLHILKDDTVVVFHDDNLKRMTGLDREISDCTYDELSELMLLTKSGDKTAQHIVKFDEEFFEMMEGGFLLIELKFDTDGHRLEKKVLEILAKYGDKLAGYALQSFDPRTVRYLNRHGCSAGLLMMQRKGVSKFINTRFVARYAKAKFLSVSRDIVSEPSVQRFRSLKGPVLCWTIRNREQLRDAEDYADGFIAEEFLDEIGYANYITEI